MSTAPIPRNSFNPFDLFRKTSVQKISYKIKKLNQMRDKLNEQVVKLEYEIEMNRKLFGYYRSKEL